MLHPSFVFGFCEASALPVAAATAAARATGTPGSRRATALTDRAPRFAHSASEKPTGRQNAVDPRCDQKLGGMTPTTCSWSPSTSMLLADDRRIAAERALPEIEGQEDGRRAGDVVLGTQHASHDRRLGEHAEEIAAHRGVGHALTVLANAKRARSPAEDRRGLEDGRVSHDIPVVGRRDPEVAQVATEMLLGDVDDAVRAGDGELAEEDAVHEREERDVPADPDGKRQAGDGREGRGSSHLPKREREVLTQDIPVCGGRRFQNVEGDCRGGLPTLGEVVPELPAMLVAHVAREKAEEQAVAERQLTERIVGASHGFRASPCGAHLELFERELDGRVEARRSRPPARLGRCVVRR